MEMIVNKVFGKLTYDFQWEKQEVVNFWGKGFSITIIVEALPDEKITTVQESNYQLINQNDEILNDDDFNLIKSYLCENYKLDISNYEDLFNHANPQSVLYKQNGKVVVLFDLNEDELGFGIEIIPNKSIGVQDFYI
mgnify:CR=1 FL=1